MYLMIYKCKAMRHPTGTKYKRSVGGGEGEKWERYHSLMGKLPQGKRERKISSLHVNAPTGQEVEKGTKQNRSEEEVCK